MYPDEGNLRYIKITSPNEVKIDRKDILKGINCKCIRKKIKKKAKELMDECLIFLILMEKKPPHIQE